MAHRGVDGRGTLHTHNHFAYNVILLLSLSEFGIVKIIKINLSENNIEWLLYVKEVQ